MGVAGRLVEAGGEGVGEGVAFALKGCEDLVGEVAGVGVFEEFAVWGAFAGGVVAVAGSRRMSMALRQQLGDSGGKGNKKTTPIA